MARPMELVVASEFLNGGPCLYGSHMNPGVHNTAALSRRQRKDGIEIYLRDRIDLFDETRHAEEHLLYGLDIGGRMAAIAFKKTVALNFSDHFSRIAIRERGDAKAHVAQDLYMDAAQAEGE